MRLAIFIIFAALLGVAIQTAITPLVGRALLQSEKQIRLETRAIANGRD